MHKDTDGIPIKKVSRNYLDRKSGKIGLWADGPNSFFNSSRKLTTVDPTDEEIELGYGKFRSTAWCAPVSKTTVI